MAKTAPPLVVAGNAYFALEAEPLANELKQQVVELQHNVKQRDQAICELNTKLFAEQLDDGHRGDTSVLTAVLKRQVAELHDVLAAKEKQMQALRLQARFTRPQEMQVEARAFIKENARLQLQLHALQTRMGQPQGARQMQELRSMQIAYDQAVAQHEAQRMVVQQSWDALEEQARELEAALGSMHKSFDALVELQQKRKDDKPSTAEALAEERLVLRLFEAEISEAQGGLDDIRSRNAKSEETLRAEIARTSTELAQRKQELSSMRAEIFELRKQVADLSARLKTVRSGHQNIRAKNPPNDLAIVASNVLSAAPAAVGAVAPAPAAAQPLAVAPSQPRKLTQKERDDLLSKYMANTVSSTSRRRELSASAIPPAASVARSETYKRLPTTNATGQQDVNSDVQLPAAVTSAEVERYNYLRQKYGKHIFPEDEARPPSESQ